MGGTRSGPSPPQEPVYGPETTIQDAGQIPGSRCKMHRRTKNGFFERCASVTALAGGRDGVPVPRRNRRFLPEKGEAYTKVRLQLETPLGHAPPKMERCSANMPARHRSTTMLQGVSENSVTRKLRTVDLFAGCGGLTLGFELHRGELEFQTVLAADIETSALKVFNQNIPAGRAAPTGRRCDLSWFSHRAEVLLYYLAHLSLWSDDAELSDALEGLGFSRYLGTLRAIDAEFEATAARITEKLAFTRAWGCVDRKSGSLALFKTAMKKLGLRSLGSAQLDHASLPWADEVAMWNVADLGTPAIPVAHEALLEFARALWADQVERFRNAAERTGKGQHRTVSARMATVRDFLATESAAQLQEAWIRWRGSRDTARANFCLGAEGSLNALYVGQRRIDILLGGPPCKGWSRIGRAVIESLREQGVHQWGCRDYGDERNALLHKYVLFLDALRPTAFLFENVAHFKSSLRTPSGSVNAAAVLEESINALTTDETEFHVEAQIVRAKRHGVPQDRERYIMVGMRERNRSGVLRAFFDDIPDYETEVALKTALLGLEPPGLFLPYDRQQSCTTSHEVKAFTFLDNQLPAATRDYLEWIRRPAPGKQSPPNKVDAHIVRAAREDDYGLYQYLAPGMRWMDYKFESVPTVVELRKVLSDVQELQRTTLIAGLPDLKALGALLAKLDDSLLLRLLLEGIDPPTDAAVGHHFLRNGYLKKGTDNHGDWLERLSPDRPCKTVVAHIGKDTYGYIHPYEPRALSIREAARVQSFPDHFSFGGSGVVDTYGMIGNAVPPLVAAHFAASFETLHRRHALFSEEPQFVATTDPEAVAPAVLV